jgi:hypothetical protein
MRLVPLIAYLAGSITLGLRFYLCRATRHMSPIGQGQVTALFLFP